MAKNDVDSVFGSVLPKTAVFGSVSVYEIIRSFGFFGSVSPTFIYQRRRHLSFTPLCHTLEMTLLCRIGPTNCQSRGDSELEVQRYGMKKNTLTVDPIMLQDEL